jgi:hypothetical protein
MAASGAPAKEKISRPLKYDSGYYTLYVARRVGKWARRAEVDDGVRLKTEEQRK